MKNKLVERKILIYIFGEKISVFINQCLIMKKKKKKLMEIIIGNGVL